MRSLLLSGIAAIALSSTAALADDAATNTAAPAKAATTSATGSTDFVTHQESGMMRAPKLVGVSVYDSNNKSVGKIDDLLVDHDGKITTVVIGIGGFLGIGKKDVAVPYSDVHWQTEQRTVAVNGNPPANAVGQTTNANSSNNSMTTTTAPAANNEMKKTIPPAETEAYNGYPDRAVLNVSQDQLKSAPEFKYASDPATKTSTDGTMNAPATKQ